MYFFFYFLLFSCYIYRNLFEKQMSVVVASIEEMHHLSQQMFFNNLSFHGSKLADKVVFVCYRCYLETNYACGNIHFVESQRGRAIDQNALHLRKLQ